MFALIAGMSRLSWKTLPPKRRGYNGIRVHLTAHMDTIKHVVSMDIGFGDIIIPKPVELDYRF